jgi:hypothetical protein
VFATNGTRFHCRCHIRRFGVRIEAPSYPPIISVTPLSPVEFNSIGRPAFETASRFVDSIRVTLVLPVDGSIRLPKAY